MIWALFVGAHFSGALQSRLSLSIAFLVTMPSLQVFLNQWSVWGGRSFGAIFCQLYSSLWRDQSE